MTEKPPYCVPSMAEIAAMPLNGLAAASTFAGGGGTSTGLRMAGFKVLWANECDPHAVETYRANHPDTELDPRDVREVTAADIMRAVGGREIDLLDGSPPCTAFSTAGKREKGWGKRKSHAGRKQDRVEDLFFEYARLLRDLQPRAFVAENVSGLIKGTAKGYFLEILKALKGCGYAVRCQVLDAQWLGVPQMRQRVIFAGVRSDLGIGPEFPKPLPYRYSVAEAIPWLGYAEHDVSGQHSHGECTDRPAFGVVSDRSGTSEKLSAGPKIKFRRGGWDDHEKRLDRGKPVPTIQNQVSMVVGNDAFEPKFGGTGQPSPTIMSGGPRTSGQFRIEHHGTGRKAGEVSKSSDRPAPSVQAFGSTGSAPHQVGIREHGAAEVRKFTIAELKRVCAFPDDYVLTGSYSQQWQRLGNSVPPVMAYWIGKAMADVLLRAGSAAKSSQGGSAR